MIIALALGGAAHAAGCTEPYGLDSLLDDVGIVESSLLSGDEVATGGAAVRLLAGLPCLDGPLPQVVAARTLRSMGAGLLSTEHAGEALDWLVTAAALDPEHRYDLESLPEGHPLFEVWDAAVQNADGLQIAELEGQVFADGPHWLDGTRLAFPRAVSAVPHLYQREVGGEVVGTYITGATFPPEDLVVSAPAEPEPEPEPVAAPAPSPYSQPVTVIEAPTWPPERVVLVAGGGAALAGSAVLYALSVGTEGRFSDSTTRVEMDRYRATTNRLAIASGASFGVGAGALGFGVLFYIIDGDPRPGLDIRF